MLHVLPLEPLAERYTIQWRTWFERALQDYPHTFIDGTSAGDAVGVGTVLDATGTNIWKFTQMVNVCHAFREGRVTRGDVFFTMDLWHPGLEAIKYMSVLYNIPVRIYGFMHAGSYTVGDFAAPMAPWARHFERGWASICDGVFVGTEYHKQRLVALRDFPSRKVYVTGNPFCTRDVIAAARREGVDPMTTRRPHTVIFPHRWDTEKDPMTFLAIMSELWRSRRQDFEVVITTSRPTFRSNSPALLEALNHVDFPYVVKAGLTKDQYYAELAKASVFVSTTIEENFGYCLLEAMTLGCTPVVVHGFSHPELLQGNYRYTFTSISQAVDKIDRFLHVPYPVPLHYAKRYDNSVGTMLDIMRGK